MFEKILIANRGEIACRIARTCRRLEIATVAVHSEADADALHVRLADEAVPIGPGAAAESYLVIERIVAAARATGARAVHPGYGFLSERPAFAEALEAEGIVFIGPPAAAIRAMGDKIESKRLARAAGVSTVPGTLEAIADPTEALRVAREIGFPVMVKASAGGGGKGMRIAHDERGLTEGLERARSEAKASFGDDRVFIEKFVLEPRHIEIQVLGDRHGNTVHLGERECSIQRRHQKVIEEAPSPFLDPAARAAMGAQAVQLAKAVGYHSAGTVEFIVDRDRNFYFLEMNTRLQVEHPVTELVTGLDLVELMLRVAAGEPLPFAQEDVRLEGWAIEARLYAEDPRRGFLPSVGRLVEYAEPAGEGIRVDAGVAAGSEVSLFYDPMLAKLCAFGPTRASAIERMRAALDGYIVRGLSHNLPFLAAVLANPRFAEGRLSTGFIAEEYGDRFESGELPRERRSAIRAVAGNWRLAIPGLAVAIRLIEARRAAEISGRVVAAPLPPERIWSVELGGERLRVTLLAMANATFTLLIGPFDEVRLTLAWRPGDRLAHAEVDGTPILAQVEPIPEGYRLTHGGAELPVLVRTARAAEYAARMPAKPPPDTSRLLRSPMPGLIVRVAVIAGAEVKAGQELCILEAMKMENVLHAERDAVVEEVKVAARDAVAADQVLMTFEPQS